jgi:hypothetical protein
MPEAGPLGETFLRGEVFGDGLGVLVEEIVLGVGADGGDTGAPFVGGHGPLSLSVRCGVRAMRLRGSSEGRMTTEMSGT